jgi:hypothetical protein
MLDVLVNKSYGIPDYISVLYNTQEKKPPATLYEAGSYNHKSSIATWELVFYTLRQIAIVCQTYSCQLSKL